MLAELIQLYGWNKNYNLEKNKEIKRSNLPASDVRREASERRETFSRLMEK